VLQINKCLLAAKMFSLYLFPPNILHVNNSVLNFYIYMLLQYCCRIYLVSLVVYDNVNYKTSVICILMASNRTVVNVSSCI